MSELNKVEPLFQQGVMDYHMHCDFSIDAVGTVEQYCEAALRRNLAEICFTTHYDNNPKAEGGTGFIRVKSKYLDTSIENLAPYVDEVRRVAEIYYLKGLSVKLGVEFGWYENCEEEVVNLDNKYSFDYILCGIHEINNICFCARSTYEKCFANLSVEQMAEQYFKQVKQAAETTLFHTIAHLNYYYKYALLYYGEAVKKVYEPFLDDTFQVLKNNQVNLEVNTAGIRHGVDSYYPNVAVLNRAKKAGVSVKYLGSDAHRPEDVGFEFEMAAGLVPDSVTGCEE